MKKRKLTEPGQACRHCGTAVERQQHPEGWKPSPKQSYWYEYWLKCPNCRAIYLMESAKRTTGGQNRCKAAQNTENKGLSTGDQSALALANELYESRRAEFSP